MASIFMAFRLVSNEMNSVKVLFLAAILIMQFSSFSFALTKNVSLEGTVSVAGTMEVDGAINRTVTISAGGGLVLPNAVTLTGIANGIYLYGISLSE
jgi:hypothetical protein